MTEPFVPYCYVFCFVTHSLIVLAQLCMTYIFRHPGLMCTGVPPRQCTCAMHGAIKGVLPSSFNMSVLCITISWPQSVPRNDKLAIPEIYSTACIVVEKKKKSMIDFSIFFGYKTLQDQTTAFLCILLHGRKLFSLFPMMHFAYILPH